MAGTCVESELAKQTHCFILHSLKLIFGGCGIETVIKHRHRPFPSAAAQGSEIFFTPGRIIIYNYIIYIAKTIQYKIQYNHKKKSQSLPKRPHPPKMEALRGQDTWRPTPASLHSSTALLIAQLVRSFSLLYMHLINMGPS